MTLPAPLKVEVPGDYVPTARVRWGGGTPRETVEYQSRIAKAVRAAMKASGWPEKYAGPVVVSVTLWGDNLRADGDNVCKGILDGAKRAHAIKDDKLKYVVACSWVHGGPRAEGAPGAIVTIVPIEPEGRCT